MLNLFGTSPVNNGKHELPERSKNSRGFVLYLLGFLPTYVYWEIMELCRRGVEVRVLIPRGSSRASMWDVITGAQQSMEEPPGLGTAAPHARLILPSGQMGMRILPRVVSFVHKSRTGKICAIRSLRDGTFRYFCAAARLAQLLRNEPIERIHVHFAKDEAQVGILLAELLGVPFTLTTHANDIFVPRDRERLRRLLARASQVFTISDFNRSYLKRSFGEAIGDHIQVTHLGVDPDTLPRRTVRRQGPYRIFCTASGLVEKKGVPYLIEACGILKRRGVSFHCTIAGSDPEGTTLSRLRKQILDSGFAGEVHLPGVVPSSRLLKQVCGSDVFVLPCIQAANGDMDGIPVSLIEAIGIGVPVVSTRLSGIPELVEDGKNGLLVSPKDSKALADALEYILNRPEEAEKMGTCGRQTVKREFSLFRYVDRLMEHWGYGSSQGEVGFWVE